MGVGTKMRAKTGKSMTIYNSNWAWTRFAIRKLRHAYFRLIECAPFCIEWELYLRNWGHNKFPKKALQFYENEISCLPPQIPAGLHGILYPNLSPNVNFQARKPFDVKDVMEQYSQGHLNMMQRIKGSFLWRVLCQNLPFSYRSCNVGLIAP